MGRVVVAVLVKLIGIERFNQHHWGAGFWV